MEPVPGALSDHYDPRSKVVGLSEGVYGGTSVAALGVAAHEVGHAVQHGVGDVERAVLNECILHLFQVIVLQ